MVFVFFFCRCPGALGLWQQKNLQPKGLGAKMKCEPKNQGGQLIGLTPGGLLPA